MPDKDRLGVPLNDTVLKRMPEEENKFWLDFLMSVQKEMGRNIKAKKHEPYKPTPSLQEKYKIAINKYQGEKYCQIQQMQYIFIFDK